MERGLKETRPRLVHVDGPSGHGLALAMKARSVHIDQAWGWSLQQLTVAFCVTLIVASHEYVHLHWQQP